MNYPPLANIIPDLPIYVSNCNRHFMFDFAQNATQDSRDFWGSNTGEHWRHSQTSGLLNSNNIFQFPCPDIEKNTPYFRDFKDVNAEEGGKYEDVDAFLYDHLDVLSHTHFNWSDRNFDYNKDV